MNVALPESDSKMILQVLNHQSLSCGRHKLSDLRQQSYVLSLMGWKWKGS